ncbi:orexin/Hypocretin receptor type 1-like [Montipora capricornis]|uniref:orexin/Hypocretin receptor type 1-like n=1 Tax=Montipora capricornis TaxID=246305 RepID=UPI0035F16AEB
MPCFQSVVNQSTSCQSSLNNSSFSLAPEAEALRLVRIVVFILIAALALVGNCVVCREVWRNPGPKPFAHYLISNLAFAEIISMICLIFTFHAYEPPYSWRLGHIMCKILDPLQISSLLVVTTTLAILAIYRCVLLVKPMGAAKLNRRKTYCAVLVSWVVSVGLSIPAGHYRVVNSYGEKCQIHYCEEIFPDGLQHHQNTYSIVLFVFNFALPLVIMAVSYSLVIKKIREYVFELIRIQEEENMVEPAYVMPATTLRMEEVQETRDRGQAERGNHAKISPDSQRTSTNINQDVIDLENDFLRMAYALVLTFIVCYIPYQVQFLMTEFNVNAFICWPHRNSFNRIVFTLTCLPSALHPVFYGLMSKTYRKAFIKMIACRSIK